jgi:intracellular sulfur oxidation DsrE/DsrF family protein
MNTSHKEKTMSRKSTLATFAISAILLLQGAPGALAEQGTSANMKPPLQIVNQTGIKVVVQINQADIIPKNGISKQVMSVKNLYDQYIALGMKPGKDFEIVMVFRADGAQFLLTDEAYDLKITQPHTKGNASLALIMAMQRGGVTMYECGMAMKMKGYEVKDILPSSRIVVSGIGAIVDLEKSGYLTVTP